MSLTCHLDLKESYAIVLDRKYQKYLRKCTSSINMSRQSASVYSLCLGVHIALCSEKCAVDKAAATLSHHSLMCSQFSLKLSLGLESNQNNRSTISSN